MWLSEIGKRQVVTWKWKSKLSFREDNEKVKTNVRRTWKQIIIGRYTIINYLLLVQGTDKWPWTLNLKTKHPIKAIIGAIKVLEWYHSPKNLNWSAEMQIASTTTSLISGFAE